MKGKKAPWALLAIFVSLSTIGAVSSPPNSTFSMFSVSIIDPPPNMERGELVE